MWKSDKSGWRAAHSSFEDRCRHERLRFPGGACVFSCLLLTVLLRSGQSCVERRHMRQPLGGARMASAGELLKFGLQYARHRPGFSVADGAEVDFPQTNNFGGSATDKNFVSNIEIFAENRRLDESVPQVPRQSDQTVTRNSLQNGSAGRSVNHIVAYQKNVLAGALGDVALRIEHDGFIEARALGFGFGQNRAHVVSGDFGLGHHDVRVQAGERRNVGANAAFLCFITKESGPLPHRNDQPRFSAVDHQVHGAVQINHRADVACGKLIGSDRLVNGGNQRVASPGKVSETDDGGGVEPGVDVLFVSKSGWSAVRCVAANAFENAETIMQAGVDDGNSAFCGILQFIIQPNVLRGICHEASIAKETNVRAHDTSKSNVPMRSGQEAGAIRGYDLVHL